MAVRIGAELSGVSAYLFRSRSSLAKSTLFRGASFGPATVLTLGTRFDPLEVYEATRVRASLKQTLRSLQESADFAAGAAAVRLPEELRFNVTDATSAGTSSSSGGSGSDSGSGSADDEPQTVVTYRTYTVSVSQLAGAQQSTIASAKTATSSLDNKKASTGQLAIQLGSYDSASNAFTAGGAATTVTVGGVGSLQDIADAINGAGLDLTAEVVSTNSGYDLTVTSNSVGSNSAFQISVSRDDVDSSLTNSKGLSQVAFDPTSGSGTALAMDALYTVDGVAGTSTTNGGVEIAPGVFTDFTSTGTFAVTVEESTTSAGGSGSAGGSTGSTGSTTSPSTTTLVASLASTVTTISLTAEPDLPGIKGAAYGIAGNLNAFLNRLDLQGDGDDSRVDKFRDGIERAFGKVFSTGNSWIASLGDIGVSRNADGTIAVDAEALAEATEEDAEAVAVVLRELSNTIKVAAEEMMTAIDLPAPQTDAAFLDYPLKGETTQTLRQLRDAEQAEQLANVVTAMLTRQARDQERQQRSDKDRDNDKGFDPVGKAGRKRLVSGRGDDVEKTGFRPAATDWPPSPTFSLAR